MQLDAFPETQRECRACGETKPIDEYYFDSFVRADGSRNRQRRCKACVVARVGRAERRRKDAGMYRRIRSRRAYTDKAYRDSVKYHGFIGPREEWVAKNCKAPKNKRDDRVRKVKLIETAAQRYVRRYREDPGFRMKERIAKALRKALDGRSKTFKTFDLLGYTPAELRAHIEKQWVGGMSWENASEWHIDHVRPKSLFDHGCPDQIKECWSLANLRPMWAKENIAKRASREYLL